MQDLTPRLPIAAVTTAGRSRQSGYRIARGFVGLTRGNGSLRIPGQFKLSCRMGESVRERQTLGATWA